VSLVELRMGYGEAVYHSLAVTKHFTLVVDENSKVMEGASKNYNLLNAGLGSHKLRTISGSLNHCLLLLVLEESSLSK